MFPPVVFESQTHFGLAIKMILRRSSDAKPILRGNKEPLITPRQPGHCIGHLSVPREKGGLTVNSVNAVPDNGLAAVRQSPPF